MSRSEAVAAGEQPTTVITTRTTVTSREGTVGPLRPLRLSRERSGVVAALTSAPVVSWVTARIAVLGALAFARFAVNQLGAADPGGRPPSGLLGWDAVWYLRILRSGYDRLPWESLRFFPLLPELARPFSWVIGSRAALLLVVNAAALVAGLLIHRLAVHETGDRALAGRAAWMLALLPPAFVFCMGYAEALLVATAAAMFLALRTRRWALAALAGVLAGLSRPFGVLLVLPALVEAARGWRLAPVRERIARGAAIVGPALGGASYLAWSWISYGDPLRPFRIQQEYDRRGDFVNPIDRLVDAGRQLLDGADLGSGLHLPWALGFLVLLAVVARRWPASYTVYAGAILLVSLSAENLDSFERYALSAFPLVLGLADLLRPAWLERAALALAAAGFVVYASLAFLGAYVP